MAAGYVAAGKHTERATFELFLRRLPRNRKFAIAAGLPQAVEYLLNLRFTGEEIDYLRRLPRLAHARPEFWEILRDFRFTGDVWAVPEGTVLFAGEPFLTLRAPIIEAQIPETFLLATISFQTMIASKAARIVDAACGRSVVEFGTRRAHSPEAGVLAARASYIGGCLGTSNVEAGFRYGIPVYGTAAHSWVQAFDNELESFRCLQSLLGESTVYLVDTYDPVEGTKKAASLGSPLWGVRLDSGNLVELSREARRILDQAGLKDAKIMVSGDLNEYKILEMMAAGLPIDALGVGTDLATSADAPNMSAVYKLVEREVGGKKRFAAKFSEDKQTLPGAKQIFRFPDRDLVGYVTECPTCDEEGAPQPDPLLRPVIVGGVQVGALPDAHTAREHARENLSRLPKVIRSLYDEEHSYRVEYSAELWRLYEDLLEQYEGQPS
ncbi:MAG: nicotinate phosphoribosyltransferase [Bryobacterales bacterium]|nr:nicotinate phosphoribosyltransferase [Bryobacterales bacterium]